MTLSQDDIVRLIFAARARISASIWLVVRDTHAAEDIFQTVAVKAINAKLAFESQGQLLSWVHVAARNASIDWLRRQRPESTVLADDVLDLLEAHAHGQEAVISPRADALRECLESVPVHSRQLLNLRYFEGRTCDEVAAEMGVKLAAVYQRLSRLHRGLKDCIDQRLAKGTP